MRLNYYLKLAVANCKKNRQLYLPYFLIGSFVIMISFMIQSIICNSDVKQMPHSDNVLLILNVAFWVVRIFAVVFLFYTNSFLIRRRKKELGLYNILGMGKKHIGIMMFYETLLHTLSSLAAGIICGIILNKLLFMLLYRLIGVDTLPGFEISGRAIMQTVIMFSVIYFLSYVFNLTTVHLSNPVELLYGGSKGEKEPKTKWLLTLIGLAFLGAGYYFALFVQSPLQAIQMFLLAVIAVVIGTYALFTSGSIVLIKLLRKNKNYYYQAKHFSAVSGLLYRMKQNAVGLASICILSTMVMLSIASTGSMYLGVEDVVMKTYPGEVNVEVTDMSAGAKGIEQVNAAIDTINQKTNAQMKDRTAVFRQEIFAKKEPKGTYEILGNRAESLLDGSSVEIMMIDLATYRELTGSDESLGQNEVLLYSSRGSENSELTVCSQDNKEKRTYTVKKQLKKKDISDKIGLEKEAAVIACDLFVMQDHAAMADLMSISGTSEAIAGATDYLIQYDTDLSAEKRAEYVNEIKNLHIEGMVINAINQDDMRYEFTQMYGSFLFIGILFAVMFLLATMMIIYYKQISEGYEDRERFEIMQKVGMSYEEVRKSIRSQIVIVFFLPLLAAGMHVAASFRIMKIILEMLSLGNVSLFQVCTLGTFAVFAVIYFAVYAVTAKIYYRIVRRDA